MNPSRPGRGVTRRELLKGAAAALGVPYVLTSGALGAPGRPPASERIVTGAIGVGGRGGHLLGWFLGDPQLQVQAVCDSDRHRREAAYGRVN
ncbi:MAG TPA: hypothetical protein VMY37_08200, partial [Thermoguttaceae bacterium]|nr:hypothetical protein [Thermoguttaceae bacterium]